MEGLAEIGVHILSKSAYAHDACDRGLRCFWSYRDSIGSLTGYSGTAKGPALHVGYLVLAKCQMSRIGVR